MAIFHLSAKLMGRSSGRSVVAAAAYRSGSRLVEDKTGRIFDYTRKAVEHAEIVAPDGCPAWVFDRQQLWNRVEAGEKRKDAQLAREVELALPRELTPEARLELLRAFVRQEFVSKGMIADCAVHCPKAVDGGQAPHAHILLTLRPIEGDAFGQKARQWNDVALLEGWRQRWAEVSNAALERSGAAARVDHRTLQAQRQDALTRSRNAKEAGQPQEADQHARQAERLNRPPEPKLGSVRQLADQAGIVLDRLTQWHVARHIKRAREHFAALGQAGIRKLEETIATSIAWEHGQRRGRDHEPPGRGPELSYDR